MPKPTTADPVSPDEARRMQVAVSCRMQYRYDEPVSLSAHTFRVFPRQAPSLTIRALHFETRPPTAIHYRRDVYDNPVGRAFFPEPSDRLEFALELRVDIVEHNPFGFLLDAPSLALPFRYSPERAAPLAPYQATDPFPAIATLPFWEPPKTDDPAAFLDSLLALNRTLAREIRYERRDEGAPYPPADTLARRSGSCRDTAVLLAQILRSQGLAARLVSGFLCEFDVDSAARRAASSLHEWTEVYLPGAGWIGLDPTVGVLCDHLYIPTAVGLGHDDVAPIAGTYFADHPVASHLEFSLETHKLA